MSDDWNALNRARRRVVAVRGFYVHGLVYGIVMAALVVVNLVNTPHYYWFVWPALGWGVFVALQGILALGNGTLITRFLPFLAQDWEEKKIKQILTEEQKRERM